MSVLSRARKQTEAQNTPLKLKNSPSPSNSIEKSLRGDFMTPFLAGPTTEALNSALLRPN